VSAAARAYQKCAEFFPNMGHNMMLEPGWAGQQSKSTSGSATKASRGIRMCDFGTPRAPL